LDKRVAQLRGQHKARSGAKSPGFDHRQRAIVKLHYFNHAGGGASALKAHVRYVARDAAGHDEPEPLGQERADDVARGRAHANYLARGGAERAPFYDAGAEGVDGAARAADWAARDKRHFRLILSAERGELLRDLPAYTREVMARAGAQLDTTLQWVAVDHHDTDNPHTHLILRGRRADGRDLVLPRDFVREQLRDIAREVATRWLGPRSREDDRLALEHDVRRHAPTRLDRLIAGQLPADNVIRLSRLAAPHDPVLTQALKARAKELRRLGLASEVKRNVLAFQPDWQDRLKALELHLDVRKRLMLERTLQRQAELDPLAKQLSRGLLGR
jgi:type IV secretory pathway VirD2 relaxase